MKKVKAGEARLATKRAAKRNRRANVAAGMACIDFERVAQICAMPREDQEKMLGAEALQLLDVLMQGCFAGGFQL
jgi:hypothetical protein